MKKIVLILTLVLTVALSYFVWSKIEAIEEKSSSHLAFVPRNAEMIVFVENINQLLIKAEENLSIYSDLKSYQDYISCRNIYDKIVSVSAETSIEDETIFAAVNNGNTKEWLAICSGYERNKNQTTLIKKFKDFEYDEYSLQKGKLYEFSYKDMQFFSSSMFAIQEAIKSIQDESFFQYAKNKVDFQLLSGSDFTLVSKAENDSWQEIDGFVKSDRVELISSLPPIKSSEIRLWDKLSKNLMCSFYPLNLDTTQANVLSGEFGLISIEKEQKVLMLGINQSLKYSLVSDQLMYDSLNQNRMKLSDKTLKELMEEDPRVSDYVDTIYGVEDVDFVLFSSSLEALNSIYFDLKKNENVSEKNSTEQLTSYSRDLFQNNLIIESKLYLEKDIQALKKVVLKHRTKVVENKEKYSWKRSFSSNITNVFQIKNHRSGNSECIVQLENNQLDLIDANGKSRWSIQIDGEIIGGISQVDIFKNGKLQMLFNTNSKLYLIDILGRNVEHFPVVLNTLATNQVAALDYQKTKDYRFLVATNKGILNYDISGKRVKGFSFNKANLNINGKIRHTLLGGNDYIMFNDQNGKLYFLNRKGEERHQSDVQILKPDVFSTFKSASSINSSSIFGLNETKNVTEYFLNKEGRSVLKDSTILTALIQIESTKRYMIGVADRSIYIYTQTGNLVREISCDFSPKHITSSLKSSQDGKLLISSKTNDLYLFDLYSDSFVDAYHGVSGSSIINDFDSDGKEDVILIEDGKNLVSYPVK